MKIATYGKGGIGKSTITSNLSATMANLGLKVFQVGCDPKSDSIKSLVHEDNYKTILEVFRDIPNIDLIKKEDIIYEGYNGIDCCECGGPEPGTGCAGRGIIKAFEILNKIVDINSYDIVNYDVLGDVVCGGFSIPLKLGYAENVVLIISGELMSIYAANNIMRAIENFHKSSDVKLAGIILNCRNVPQELELAEKFCFLTNCILLGVIPRSNSIFKSDYANKLAVNEDPKVRVIFENIAHKILESKTTLPEPLSQSRLKEFMKLI